eukprot:4488659-Prymnesium_polylepis.2
MADILEGVVEVERTVEQDDVVEETEDDKESRSSTRFSVDHHQSSMPCAHRLERRPAARWIHSSWSLLSAHNRSGSR